MAVMLGLFVFIVGALFGIWRTSSVLGGEIARLGTENAELTEKITEYEQGSTQLDENGVRIDRMYEFYGYDDTIGSWPSEIQTDAEFRGYCQEHAPGAVYPSTEWMADEVIEAWLAAPEIWGYYMDEYNPSFTSFYFTWTADYEHCFILDVDLPYSPVDAETGEHLPLISGWLVVDGVRVQMLDKETYSVDYRDLLEAYWSGEWDGSQRRSPDGSTTAYVSYYDATIVYSYETWRYDETVDPQGWAYTGYAERPWWQEENVSEEVLARFDAQDLKQIVDDGQMNQPTWIWTYGSRLYVDVPLTYDAGEVLAKAKTEQGTFLMTPTEVLMFDRGELVESWPGEFNKETQLLMAFEDPSEEYAQDLAYIYDGAEVLALKAQGETEPVLERIFYKNSQGRGLWGFQGDNLLFWLASTRYTSRNQPEILGNKVLEVDFSTLQLFVRTDGTYAIKRVYNQDHQYETVYLGAEPPEYYLAQYEMMRSAVKTYW